METICLISCYSVFEANVIKGKLESEGIECFLTNENKTNHCGVCNSDFD